MNNSLASSYGKSEAALLKVFSGIKTNTRQMPDALFYVVGYSFGCPSGLPGLPTKTLYHIYFWISIIFSKSSIKMALFVTIHG